ncbi:hypothetical protein AB0L82_21435 [Nocardia sp. NPDC052001]|uniref:hypothetical protein n=1 Tax=Nocardia sp. NPDC052001 TaxID=3154853 RepID=UPI0034436E70
MSIAGDEQRVRPIGRRAEDAGAPRPNPAVNPFDAEDAAPVDPVLRLLDEIDALVEDSMRDGEPETGYDFDDPTYPDCPNPHCDEPWHGLAITARMSAMRWRGLVDPDYDYDTDDSPLLCPGSRHTGEWPVPEGEAVAEYFAAQEDSEHEFVPDPRLVAADAMWMAVGRAATAIWVTSLPLAVVSMFTDAARWRWLTLIIGIVSLSKIYLLFGRTRRALPPGYLRQRLSVRPETIPALALMFAAGWLPALWAWRYPRESSGYLAACYRTLLVSCLLAGIGHAVVQLSRARTVPDELVDGVPETDRPAHGGRLLRFAFGWLIFTVPLLLLFGWTLGRFTHQPDAVWVATGVTAIVLATLVVEAVVLNRALLVIRATLLVVIATVPLLWWSLHALSSADFHR